MTKKYFIKEVSDAEMVKCPTCDGTGKIIGDITSPSLTEPIVNHELSCPTCGGSGEVATGKTIHYKIGIVVVYGNAHVEDDNESGNYTLGFVCDDDSIIEKFKEQNGISSFVSYPNALSFYMENEATIMYDTYEEAEKVMLEKEAAWKEPKLELVK